LQAEEGTYILGKVVVEHFSSQIIHTSSYVMPLTRGDDPYLPICSRLLSCFPGVFADSPALYEASPSSDTKFQKVGTVLKLSITWFICDVDPEALSNSHALQ
jgi:hypothetical protein